MKLLANKNCTYYKEDEIYNSTISLEYDTDYKVFLDDENAFYSVKITLSNVSDKAGSVITAGSGSNTIYGTTNKVFGNDKSLCRIDDNIDVLVSGVIPRTSTPTSVVINVKILTAGQSSVFAD